MTSMKTIWEQEMTARTSECDREGRWRAASCVAALSEAAGWHAFHLGAGHPELSRNGMAWVCSRFKVHFYQPVNIARQVVIRTWPKGVQRRLFFMRDFLVLPREGGQACAAATSAWTLIDPVQRRLLPANALGAGLPDNGGLSALDEPLEKIALPEGMVERLRVTARYSALDVMGHVNNARYIEWMADCFDPDEHTNKKLEWIQINYASEVLPGEEVSLRSAPHPTEAGIHLFEGWNLTREVRAFEAAWCWGGH